MTPWTAVCQATLLLHRINLLVCLYHWHLLWGLYSVLGTNGGFTSLLTDYIAGRRTKTNRHSYQRGGTCWEISWSVSISHLLTRTCYWVNFHVFIVFVCHLSTDMLYLWICLLLYSWKTTNQILSIVHSAGRQPKDYISNTFLGVRVPVFHSGGISLAWEFLELYMFCPLVCTKFLPSRPLLAKYWENIYIFFNRQVDGRAECEC